MADRVVGLASGPAIEYTASTQNILPPLVYGLRSAQHHGVWVGALAVRPLNQGRKGRKGALAVRRPTPQSSLLTELQC